MSKVDSIVSAAHLSAIEKIGTRLDGTFTAEQAMEAAHLSNWNVRKSPVFTFDEAGNRHEVMPGRRFAVVRDNPFTGKAEVLDEVGGAFQIIQNEEHAEFLNTLVDESGAHFELAGSFNHGKRVFISMRLPGHIKIGGVDKVDTSLLAINGHDGSCKFTVAAVPVRFACGNVMNLSYENRRNAFSVRHTTNAMKSIVGEARRVLDISFDYMDAFQRQAEQLINTTMTQVRFEDIIAKEFGPTEDTDPKARTRMERKVEEMVDLFAEAGTQDGIRDTAWAGLNALTEWYDHFSPVRGDDRDTTRAAKAITDPSFKNRALELMLQG